MLVYVLMIDGKRSFVSECYVDVVMKMIQDSEKWKKEIEELRKEDCKDLPYPGDMYLCDELICKMCSVVGRKIGDIFDDYREYEIVEDYCDDVEGGMYYVIEEDYVDDFGYDHYIKVDILDKE